MEKKRVALILQARMGSTRLPGKVLLPILGKPMLSFELERLKQARTVDVFTVATGEGKENDPIEALAREAGFTCHRGSEDDVLDRYYRAAQEAGASVIVRVTGDCPLHDPRVIDLVVRRFQQAEGNVAYTSTPANYPEGFDTEVCSFATLERAWKEAHLRSEREHVTEYIKNHPELFAPDTWKEGTGAYSHVHLSVDTQEDFLFVGNIITELYPKNPLFSKDDVLAFLSKK